MIFGRGRIPEADFFINNEKLEHVKEFKYLGVVLTPQLSFARHVQIISTKAKARIAYLYMVLPLLQMSLGLVVKIFETYILPLYQYCAAIWTYDFKSQNVIQEMNAVFTNYIKRYLGLPKSAHNAAVHYYCGTWPLYNAIKSFSASAVFNIRFPSDSMEGHQLSIAKLVELPPYVPEHEMASDFPKVRPNFSEKLLFQTAKVSGNF